LFIILILLMSFTRNQKIRILHHQSYQLNIAS